MEDRIVERLRKVLALTGSPIEGEAQAAAAMLHKLLTDYNLSIADLEQKGSQRAPGVKERGHDLGKAAFKWKLDLAESIAEYYYCHPLVDRDKKTVAFVGRPDNVESLQMLYGWIIDQVKRIATDERRVYMADHDEHVDPLRWQVNFGIGAVERLGVRLEEQRSAEAAEVDCVALVLHHKSEISDYLEAQGGYRIDGRRTKEQEQREVEWQEYIARCRKEEAEREALKEDDPDEYYRLYPGETPEAKAKEAEERSKRIKKERAREKRNAARRTGPAYRDSSPSASESHRRQQADRASMAGYRAADRVNLQPFLKEGTSEKDSKRKRIG